MGTSGLATSGLATSGLATCREITLQHHADARGGLSIVEAARDLPFAIARIYWLTDTPEGITRVRHAHKALWQLYVAVAGSVMVRLDDGREQRVLRLASPQQGLIIGPMVWREVGDFTPGAVLLAAASGAYDEGDYIRDHAAFLGCVS